MNIVDCLAIAPYYLDLFFAPPPLLDPEAASVRQKVELEGEEVYRITEKRTNCRK